MDSGELTGKVRFALCVSLEVAIGSAIPIYEEIRDRIRPQVVVQPIPGDAVVEIR